MARTRFSFRSIQMIAAVLPALLISGCGGGNKGADTNTTTRTTTPTPTQARAMTTGGNMSTTHMTNGMTTSHMNGGNMGNSHTTMPNMTSGGMGTRMTSGGMGSALPAGYKRDKNGRVHGRNGQFVKESGITSDPFNRKRDKLGRFINGQKGPGFMNSR
ncbi:MAG: hypothetical protein M3Y56_06725 [Armatimonadota bacterium]|nr:hypothetical protein [Armatimonadota bacterium]